MKAEQIDQEFLELVNRYQPVLHRVCRMYADGVEDRRDLFQEMLFQLWRSYGSFQGRSSFGTWLYRIALNTAISAMRKERKKPEQLEFDEQTAPQPKPSDSLREAERIDRLHRAIGKLNPIDRALVMLYLDDLSYREMADILGLSETHVGAKLNRIKTRLQHLVEERR